MQAMTDLKQQAEKLRRSLVNLKGRGSSSDQLAKANQEVRDLSQACKDLVKKAKVYNK